MLALARSRGARPPRPCSSAPSPMSLLSTTARRARRPAQHARARVVPETIRSTNFAAPVTPHHTRRASPTTPANARVRGLPSNSKCYAPALSGRAGPPDPPRTSIGAPGIRTRRTGCRALPQALVTPGTHPLMRGFSDLGPFAWGPSRRASVRGLGSAVESPEVRRPGTAALHKPATSHPSHVTARPPGGRANTTNHVRRIFSTARHPRDAEPRPRRVCRADAREAPQ